MVAQSCEYTKTHWIIYFKKVTIMVCELYTLKKGGKTKHYSSSSLTVVVNEETIVGGFGGVFKDSLLVVPSLIR